MHRLLATPLIAALATLTVAGCAASAPTLHTPTPVVDEMEGCATPGPASDAVTASGALGGSPVVAADGPFSVDRVERSILVEGPGESVDLGDLVEVAITMLNATSGDQAPGTATARVLVREGSALPGLLATIRCTPAGSRVVGVVPSEDAYGTAGQPELSIGPGDDIVFVVDVLAVLPLQATGTPVELPEDFPALELSFDSVGRPTVGVPQGDPPATLQSAVLLEGDGPTVAAGDEILLQFQAVNWRTGEVYDETWGDVPRSLLTLLPGVDASLLDRPAGSRIVVVVPPADGFGSTGSPSSGVTATDTVVYVVDILATTPAPV